MFLTSMCSNMHVFTACMCVLIWFVWCMYFIQDIIVIITGVTLQRLTLSIHSRKANSLVMLFLVISHACDAVLAFTL